MSSPSRTLIALVCGIGSGCTLVTDLRPLERDGIDAGIDTAVTDAGTEDRSTPQDASGDSPSVLDGSDGALADADTGPCSGPLLVGSSDITVAGTDMVAVGTTDAYGYTAVAAGTARCAWVHLDAAGAGLQLGVYSDATPNGPSQLKATALINAPKVGWNAALLDTPVVVSASSRLWLALLVTGQAATIRVSTTCSDLTLNRVSRTGFAMASPFNGTGGNGECKAPFYLTP